MPEHPTRIKLMRHAFALAHDLGLHDDERREYAMMLPTRSGAEGGVSWATLTEEELAVLVQRLEGGRLLLALYRLRV